MAMNPAGLDPVKPQALNPRLALPELIRCQTSLNSLIYEANFGNYVRVTDPNFFGRLPQIVVASNRITALTTRILY